MYSHHIFYFPFKWEIQGMQEKLFSEQTDLEQICVSSFSNWMHNPGSMGDEKEKEEKDLYNEKNFLYEFVHPVLYDTGTKDTLIKHFVRREPNEHDVFYRIAVKDRVYELKVKAINLNFYTTGVGMLTFFLQNMRADQKSEEAILSINQYGRRIFPPFYGDIELRSEIAHSISIDGLLGSPDDYTEDFNSYTTDRPWTPACFINRLITEVDDRLLVRPVIDDRMFVNCWFPNNIRSHSCISSDDKAIESLVANDFWYKFLFIDCSSMTCQNTEMQKRLVKEQSYLRWQKYGSLYGASRYSFVFLSNEEYFAKNVLAVYMRTIYSRIIELVLIQRASTLRFSEEVTRVGGLSKKMGVNKKIIDQISSLYKEYIRFINKIHFREVTTQDQGIELYDLLHKTLKVNDYVRDLAGEIEELYRYVNLLDDKVRDRQAAWLNMIATIFLPATLCASLFCITSDYFAGMSLSTKIIIIVSSSAVMSLLLTVFKRFYK